MPNWRSFDLMLRRQRKTARQSGLHGTGIANGLAYLAQRSFHDDHALASYEWKPPYVKDLPEAVNFKDEELPLSN